jgi:hypothetical protein
VVINRTEAHLGDQVIVNREDVFSFAMGFDENVRIPPGTFLTITRMYSESVMARTVEPINVPYRETARHATFVLSNYDLDLATPDAVTKALRKLGTKPEGDEYIGIDHPGIQWLWEDLAKYADRKSWCSEYDKLAQFIGIPGRPREFAVTVTLPDGIHLTGTVQARTQDEANQSVMSSLATITLSQQ